MVRRLRNYACVKCGKLFNVSYTKIRNNKTSHCPVCGHPADMDLAGKMAVAKEI